MEEHAKHRYLHSFRGTLSLRKRGRVVAHNGHSVRRMCKHKVVKSGSCRGSADHCRQLQPLVRCPCVNSAALAYLADGRSQNCQVPADNYRVCHERDSLVRLLLLTVKLLLGSMKPFGLLRMEW